MGMILRIASSRIVGQGDIVGRSGYFSLNLSANSVMRGRLDARRTLKSLVADLRYIKNEIAIPKYFFMAVLFRSGDNYKAIGFYMPHENLKDDPDKKDPKKYLMSIDALEQETGIDFFHNLPDNIENTVEATYNVNDWQW